MKVLQPIGRFFLVFLATAGRLAHFTGHGFSLCTRPRRVPHPNGGSGVIVPSL